MVNLSCLPSVTIFLKNTLNNCFFKSGIFNVSNEFTGLVKFGNKSGTLACIPNRSNLTSKASFNNPSILFNCHSLLFNNSSCRHLSTISSSTETDDEKRKLIELEIELLKDEGHHNIPSTLTSKELQELAGYQGSAARQRFLRHLFIIEQKKIKQHVVSKDIEEMIKDRRKIIDKELLESEETGLPSYGLWRNSIYMKWDDKRMNFIRHNRIISASLHGQHIVFDNSFDYCMTRQEKTDIAKQFGMAMNSNREHADPFYFHLCNFSLKRELSQKMVTAIPTLLDKSYPVDVHEENYLDHFPRDRLVYVTPCAREDMTKFDNNAVYIIGNLIRHGNNSQVEVAKVKKEGIKMQKLPLDRYLDWGTGTKSLPVNIVLRILLDFRHTGSWVQAFDKHIPKRKLHNQDESEVHEMKKAMRKPQHIKTSSNYNSKGWFK